MSINTKSAAIAGAVAAAFAVTASPASAAENEKCYGISLAGENGLRGRARNLLFRNING